MPLFVNSITPSVMHSVTGTASHMPCGEKGLAQFLFHVVCLAFYECKGTNYYMNYNTLRQNDSTCTVE